MVVVYVPILTIKQKRFLETMIKRGWKHMGHTKLKDFLGTEMTVAEYRCIDK